MPDERPTTAAALRKHLRQRIDQERLADQPFAIRLWRAISWLARAESLPEADIDGRFIALWIAFNAGYGCLEEGGGLSAPDHARWQQFLAQLVRLDAHDRLWTILWQQQKSVLKLLDSPYQFRPFWLNDPQAPDKLANARRQAMQQFVQRNVLWLLQELFERLYVLRQQVFHGACTSGSKLNRPVLTRAVEVLAAVVPAMAAIQLEGGPAIDWGELCFPPIRPDNVRR